MPQLAKPLIKARAARLRAAGQAALQRHLASRIGYSGPVLVEKGGIGRLDDFTPVRLSAGEVGHLARVTITGHDEQMLLGTLI